MMDESDNCKGLLREALYWLESIGSEPAKPDSVLGRLIARIREAAPE